MIEFIKEKGEWLKDKGFGFYSPRRRRERREIYISHPDEIRATTISSRLNRRAIPKARPDEIGATEISLVKHLTGQVGQADSHRCTQTYTEQIRWVYWMIS